MSEEKFTPTIIAFQNMLAEFRIARLPVLEKLNISRSGMAVLSMLYREGEGSRIELADRLGLTTTAIGRPIDQLVRLELIQRVEDSSNRRYIKLNLTNKGLKLAKAYRKKMSAIWGDAFQEISDEKLNQFTETIEKIVERLKKQRQK